MLTLLWLLAGTSGVVAVAAWAKARRIAKRFERLTESYWELRYEQGQLRARLNRLDQEQPAASLKTGEAGRRPTEMSGTAFVPLSSLKR